MKIIRRSSLSMIQPVVHDDECSISSENSTISVIPASKTTATTTTTVVKPQVNSRRRRTVHFEEAKNETGGSTWIAPLRISQSGKPFQGTMPYNDFPLPNKIQWSRERT